MKLSRMLRAMMLFALAADGGLVFSEPLRLQAGALVGPTNIDWMAFARAHLRIRSSGTESVEFIWESPPSTGYSAIRRSLWLAALHGITNQTGPDERTRRLMARELKLAKERLETPFASDVAVRDVGASDRLVPLLCGNQTSCLLIARDEMCRLTTVLRCTDSAILNEPSGITFTSLSMAATFTQSCYSENGLVFERDGHVADSVFLRRFQDKTATVVNLTDKPRIGLCYWSGRSRYTFDLPPAGVVHILNSTPFPLLCDKGEPFVCELWRVESNSETPLRLIRSDLLPTVIGESYTGTIRYHTTVCIPQGTEDLFLHLDSQGSESELSLNGQSLGLRAWHPFDWPIPKECRGKNATIDIRIEKRSVDEFLQSAPVWFRRR